MTDKIVRCKDCDHRDPEDKKCYCGELERAGCIFPVADDYYCAYGEVRRHTMTDKQYLNGFRDAKEIIIREIAKQYASHNEVVPNWLSIGYIRPHMEAQNDQ